MYHIQYAVRMQIKSWFTVLRCGKRVMVRRKDDELTGHAFRRPYIDAVCREAGNAEFQFMRPPHVTTKHSPRDSLYRTRRDALCNQPSRPLLRTASPSHKEPWQSNAFGFNLYKGLLHLSQAISFLSSRRVRIYWGKVYVRMYLFSGLDILILLLNG